MSLEFRLATAADASELANILTNATQYKLDHDDLAWGIEPYTEDEVMLRIKNNNTYLAYLEDEPVGTLVLQWDDDSVWGIQPSHAGYIHGFAIRDGFHGHGLGTQMLDWAANEVSNRGYSYLRLDCPAANAQLRAYYERHAFVQMPHPNPSKDTKSSVYYQRPLH